MKTFLQTLFFFLLVTQICFAQWHQQNSETTKNLNAVTFIDDYNGFAVGDSGTILKTTDLGSSWNIQTSGTTQNLYEILFVDNNNGWVVGGGIYWPSLYRAVILKTTNGGISWFQQMSDTTYCLNAIYFIDANTGWAVGKSYDVAIGCVPIILETTDGGINWLDQSVATTIPLNDVLFMNENIGFIAGGSNAGDGGYGEILMTTDGGDTWNLVFSGNICWHQLLFLDALNGFAVGNERPGLGLLGSIYRTTDGGISWISAYVDGSIFSLNTIAFSDSNHIWVGGGNFYSLSSVPGKILFSSDKGQNWSTQGEFLNTPYDICFISASTGWAVGDSGTILHTTNGGVSFVEEEQIDEMPTTYFLSNNFPNPFNPSTKIKYSVPQSSNVVIKVFDVLGEEIETLVNEEKPVSTYELTWSAANLPSGVYFYQLRAGEFIETKKMVLLR